MTGRKLHMIDSNFLKLIIHIWNLLARLSLFHSFSCHYFLCLYFKSEFTVFSRVPNTRGVLIIRGFGSFCKIYKRVGFDKQVVRNFSKQVFYLYIYIYLKVSGLCYKNCKLLDITKFTVVLPTFWLRSQSIVWFTPVLP